ncbi:MAG TPA: PfkB family carbohydrate kinase [Solirubrobacterales bacterium]|nr:PfkB family carbohydrate kinase [Solirubrobacterales bacterium]
MILCLGEALVDLISDRRARSFADAGCFRPHFGGALANVAVASSRAGAPTALAGAAGDDEWGDWLCDRLAAEGVDLSWFERLRGEPTPVAFAIVDQAGDPRFQIYGESIAAAVAAVEPRLDDALAAADALVFGSTTLASEGERAATLRARELALERGVRVCFDPNIRPNRWGGDPVPAIAASRELVGGSFCVRANREEAVAIAGEDDPRRAADAIAEMGAEIAVVTLGAGGAVIRGACEADAPAAEVEVVSTLGAGDAFMGTLVAEIAAREWDPARAAEALAPALEAAGDACTRLSALG